MEYLMTYGWALLVIVIVIAILLIINPFSTPQVCRFDQIGFNCENPLLRTTGQLYVRATNNNNNAIKIMAIQCTSDKSSTPPTYNKRCLGGTCPDNTGINVARSGSMEIGSVATGDLAPLQCYSSNAVPYNGLTTGSDATVKLWVWYKNSEDPASYPERITSATITTKVATT